MGYRDVVLTTLLLFKGSYASLTPEDTNKHQLLYRDADGQHHRILEELPADTNFPPLACNANLDKATCEAVLSPIDYSVDSKPVEVPCGECWSLDGSGSYNFVNGLNIVGKLVIGPGIEVNITAPYIFVQGQLDVTISPEEKIPSNVSNVEITLTGKDEITFVRYDDGEPGPCKDGCNPSVRPFIVAGGKVNFSGMSQSCPSWVKVNKMQSWPTTVTDFPMAPKVRGKCALDKELLKCDFRKTCKSNKDYVKAFGASKLRTDRGVLIQESRRASWSGPMIEILQWMKNCIQPEIQYQVSAQVGMGHANSRYRRRDRKSRCQIQGTNCPGIFIVYQTADGKWNNRIVGAISGNIENYKYYDLTTEPFQFTPEELDSANKELLILISGPEEQQNIMLKSLIMKPVEGVYPNPKGPCKDLILHGAVGDMLTTIPWTTTGGSLSLSTDDEKEYYYSHSARDKGIYALKQDIVLPECITPGDIYKFSVTSRVNTTAANFALMPMMRIFPEGETRGRWSPLASCTRGQMYEDGFVTCEGIWKMSTWVQKAEVLELFMMSTAEGDVEYKNIELTYVENDEYKSLIVDEAIAECWDVGAEVMLTSQTIDHEGELISTIKEIRPTKGGVAVTLEHSTAKWLVYEDERDFSKPELALLSRNIRIKGEGNDDQEHGAHFEIMHTHDVVQTVNGAEFRNMGQLGTKGRYPVHFHMNGRLEGTTITKNVVRDSFQRCYVIHGTDALNIYDNIAYNTTGHCWFFEDGCEIDNVLERNLGARTLEAPKDKLTAADETDHEPSTYWLSNGDNWVRGNVAAGGEGHGFWYEMKRMVRNLCGQLPSSKGVDPQAVNLKQCENNYAHSNRRHGITTYPGAGYKPKDHGVFRNNYSYRNRMSGIFFHNSGNVGVDGGVVTDNRVGVDVDRAHSISIKNVEIMGFSPDFKRIIMDNWDRLNWQNRICPGDAPIYGVHDHPYYFGGGLAKGTTIENISLDNFFDIGCEGSTPISVDDFEDLGFFDPRTNYAGVQFKEEVPNAPRIELCSAKEGGVDYVAIQDLDGSVSGEAGMIVTDSDKMNFVGWDDCITHPSYCAKFCPGKCLRTMGLFTNILTDSGFSLEVTGDKIVGTHKVIGYFDIENDGEDPDEFQLTSAHFTRKFFLTLPPGGNYEAKFYLNGEHAWPTFAAMGYEDAPGGCGANFTSFNLIKPPLKAGECSDLIKTGDFEDGTTGMWTHLSDGLKVTDKSFSGSYALTSKYASTTNMGPTYFLDSRCLTTGSIYHFSGKVKLVNEAGTALACAERCVIAWLMEYSGASNRETKFRRVGMVTDYITGWNDFEFDLEVKEDMADLESVALVLSRPPSGKYLVIDDVSLTMS